MTRGGARLRVNGEDSRQVDATDRGLQYGDGLFETIAVVGGKPRLLAAHLERLLRGCARLDIGPVAESLIEEDVAAVSGPRAAAVPPGSPQDSTSSPGRLPRRFLACACAPAGRVLDATPPLQGSSTCAASSR
jgi:branched-subunit amino acid aminotransferase/4-amino-4-deoxychorismate lyase